MILLCALSLGCSRAIPGESDSSTVRDSSMASDLSTPRDLADCASRTTTIPGNRPIEIGSFCDELSFCTDDPGRAPAAFECGISARCQPTQQRCEWRRDASGVGIGTVDAAELAQICAATGLTMQVVCMVYI